MIVALPLSQTLKRVLPKWSFRRKKDEQMTIDEKMLKEQLVTITEEVITAGNLKKGTYSFWVVPPVR